MKHRTFPVILLLQLLLLLQLGSSKLQPYRLLGCSENYERYDFMAKPVTVGATSNITSACFNKCSEKNYPYFEIRSGSNCICLTIWPFKRVSGQICSGSEKIHFYAIYPVWMEGAVAYVKDLYADKFEKEAFFYDLKYLIQGKYTPATIVIYLDKQFPMRTLLVQIANEEPKSLTVGTEVWISEERTNHKNFAYKGKQIEYVDMDKTNIKNPDAKFHHCGTVSKNVFMDYEWFMIKCNKYIKARTILFRKLISSRDMYFANLRLITNDAEADHLIFPNIFELVSANNSCLNVVLKSSINGSKSEKIKVNGQEISNPKENLTFEPYCSPSIDNSVKSHEPWIQMKIIVYFARLASEHQLYKSPYDKQREFYFYHNRSFGFVNYRAITPIKSTTVAAIGNGNENENKNENKNGNKNKKTGKNEDTGYLLPILIILTLLVFCICLLILAFCWIRRQKASKEAAVAAAAAAAAVDPEAADAANAKADAAAADVIGNQE